MCLSTAALATFLTLIAGAPMTTEPGRIIVRASDQDVHWVEATAEDRWCTMAPQLDRLARFEAL